VFARAEFAEAPPEQARRFGESVQTKEQIINCQLLTPTRQESFIPALRESIP